MARRLFEHLQKTNKDLALELSRICDEAAEIWKSQHLREFTIHNKLHYEQVEANLDSLTANLQMDSHALSPEEIFVLIAACYLHDIGMQLEAIDAREKHAQYAYELILPSSVWVEPEQRKVTLTIHDQNARVAIAKVARGHWTDFALKLPEVDYLYGQSRGRLRLLGILLATADLLDTSAIRAGYFRSDHRMFGLKPVSELHQTLHALVVGYQIKPEDPHVPDKLVFELEWQDKSELVQKISEWQMRWFSSQIRQTALELERLSGGSIRWATPWAWVVFRDPEGPLPLPKLSAAALRVLDADLAAQRRIDRDQFIKEFKQALQGRSPTLFVLPLSSESDAKHLIEWCRAHVESSQSFLVGQLVATPDHPAEVSTHVAELLQQWGSHMEIADNETAVQRLRTFVEERLEKNFLVFAEAQDPSSLEPVLGIMLKAGNGARVVVLRCPNKGPVLPEVEVKIIGLPPFERNDIALFLEHHCGYNAQHREDFLFKIEKLGLTNPGSVYAYVELSDRDSWRTSIASKQP